MTVGGGTQHSLVWFRVLNVVLNTAPLMLGNMHQLREVLRDVLLMENT